LIIVYNKNNAAPPASGKEHPQPAFVVVLPNVTSSPSPPEARFYRTLTMEGFFISAE
jgi:hypothetical protein